MIKFKLLLYISLLYFILLPQAVFSQDPSSVSEDVSRAIREGKATEMSKHFGQNVDLTLPGSEGTFSRSQSEMILRDFFSNNPPESFSENHSGSSRDGSVYVIGTYRSEDNKNFRVYFYIKKVSQTFFLHQLQFEIQ